MPELIDAHWHSYMSCNTMIDPLIATLLIPNSKLLRRLLKLYSEVSQPFVMRANTYSDYNVPLTKASFLVPESIQAAPSSLKQVGTEISELFMKIPIRLTVAD